MRGWLVGGRGLYVGRERNLLPVGLARFPGELASPARKRGRREIFSAHLITVTSDSAVL